MVEKSNQIYDKNYENMKGRLVFNKNDGLKSKSFFGNEYISSAPLVSFYEQNFESIEAFKGKGFERILIVINPSIK